MKQNSFCLMTINRGVRTRVISRIGKDISFSSHTIKRRFHVFRGFLFELFPFSGIIFRGRFRVSADEVSTLSFSKNVDSLTILDLKIRNILFFLPFVFSVSQQNLTESSLKPVQPKTAKHF